jgi:hypothetical protein
MWACLDPSDPDGKVGLPAVQELATAMIADVRLDSTEQRGDE